MKDRNFKCHFFSIARLSGIVNAGTRVGQAPSAACGPVMGDLPFGEKSRFSGSRKA